MWSGGVAVLGTEGGRQVNTSWQVGGWAQAWTDGGREREGDSKKEVGTKERLHIRIQLAAYLDTYFFIPKTEEISRISASFRRARAYQNHWRGGGGDRVGRRGGRWATCHVI